MTVGTVGQVTHPQAAQASVSAGDLVFTTTQFGDGDGTEIAQYSSDTVTILTGTDETNGIADQDPAVSPNGGVIAYQSLGHTSGGDPDQSLDGLYVMNADGSDVTQLTYSSWYGGHDNSPTVSPDGDTIAYADDGGIYTIPSDSDEANGTEVDSGAGDGAPAYVLTSWSMKDFTVLGDSFSSGEGNPSFISPTGTDGCDRSPAAYALALADTPDGLAPDNFVACSGATSGDIVSGLDGEEDQLDAIGGSGSFVILPAGGDDVDFEAFATACVESTCEEGSDAYVYAYDQIEDSLPSNLSTLFSAIADTISPGTRVLVLGYPDPLPPSSDSCDGVSPDSSTGAQTILGDLNSAIDAAVTSADVDGKPFEYVDPYDQFEGHDLCSEDSYFNGIEFILKYSLHPNVYGQEAYVQAVEAYLRAHPSAP